MYTIDDDLREFETEGALPLPKDVDQSRISHRGADIWYASAGAGRPVVLLHGGLGNSGNWGYQVPALVEQGYRVILVDSRGHGRSTRDQQPFSYRLMASDVSRVLDELGIPKAAFVGWSDGACTAMIIAQQMPERCSGVFFFACNMDPSGTKPFEFTPILGRCLNRHQADYKALSQTPDQFDALMQDLGEMQGSQPNFTVADLAGINAPVAVVQSERDEFIKFEHAQYLANTLPNGSLIVLQAGTHFAPVQRPELFNKTVLGFLQQLEP